jgi:hypothetical protein
MNQSIIKRVHGSVHGCVQCIAGLVGARMNLRHIRGTNDSSIFKLRFGSLYHWPWYTWVGSWLLREMCQRVLSYFTIKGAPAYSHHLGRLELVPTASFEHGLHMILFQPVQVRGLVA